MKTAKLLIMCMVFIISISLAYAADNVVFSEVLYNPNGSNKQPYNGGIKNEK